jgi:hypothetical protein
MQPEHLWGKGEGEEALSSRYHGAQRTHALHTASGALVLVARRCFLAVVFIIYTAAASREVYGSFLFFFCVPCHTCHMQHVMCY